VNHVTFVVHAENAEHLEYYDPDLSRSEAVLLQDESKQEHVQ